MRQFQHRRSLLAAGLGTLGIAAAQVLMPFSRAVVQAFGAPSGWSAPLLVIVSLTVAAAFAYTGACALSVAGVVRPLPFSRVMVALAALGFMVRGFSLVPQLLAETSLFDPADATSGAGLVASAASLGLGVLYVVGLSRPADAEAAGERP